MKTQTAEEIALTLLPYGIMLDPSHAHYSEKVRRSVADTIRTAQQRGREQAIAVIEDGMENVHTATREVMKWAIRKIREIAS
jgi:selenocysteine lyase/cysteine desulfurase